VTGREEDRFVFRVPSLRLVSLTAPYFHDGDVDTLEHAIVVMGRYQLGREIPPDDVARIASFLATLAGDMDPEGRHGSG
jgi:cytochrome c peroxidase